MVLSIILVGYTMAAPVASEDDGNLEEEKRPRLKKMEENKNKGTLVMLAKLLIMTHIVEDNFD